MPSGARRGSPASNRNGAIYFSSRAMSSDMQPLLQSAFADHLHLQRPMLFYLYEQPAICTSWPLAPDIQLLPIDQSLLTATDYGTWSRSEPRFPGCGHPSNVFSSTAGALLLFTEMRQLSAGLPPSTSAPGSALSVSRPAPSSGSRG